MVVQAARPASAGTAASFWLDELRDAHARLLVEIDELERLSLGRPVPEKKLLIETRWKLSAASLSRRLLWGRIHAYLSPRVPPSLEGDLRQLQETDIRLISASAKHVGKWTADSILGDWLGYCEASKLMRREMLEAIAGEKRLLYPILECMEHRQQFAGQSSGTGERQRETLHRAAHETPSVGAGIRGEHIV